MSEIIQRAETALQNVNHQMTRYRALETMDAAGYNPVKELIELAKTEKDRGDAQDKDLQLKIHLKLLEYYSATPKKQLAVDVSQQGQVVVMPVSFHNQYAGKDLAPCKPQLIDVIVQKNALEELMGDAAAPHTNT